MTLMKVIVQIYQSNKSVDAEIPNAFEDIERRVSVICVLKGAPHQPKRRVARCPPPECQVQGPKKQKLHGNGEQQAGTNLPHRDQLQGIEVGLGTRLTAKNTVRC